ncbi:unnamed protein product [Heterosigma akashiwo]|uniref:CHORD domain-containing protein n=1 Tax=Heterosigma akashiwo TaxID=2829 RepID=A0A6V2Q7H8_HETAK|mmetsp:Transcript_1105/g.1405  ORF Transcript_1105/g.1405 Transcript_1105/m.1405 type:complete len:327 (+) Transcript_1105:124-1104(+)
MKVYVHYEEGSDESLHKTLKLTLPKKWADKETNKVLDLFLESYNAKNPGNLLEMGSVHLENSRGQKMSGQDLVKDLMNDREDIHVRPGAPPAHQEAPAAKEQKSEAQTNEGKLRCRNYGCNQWYLEAENGPEACGHHTAPPIFHDARKGWSCCAKRVYDWDEFQQIAGCARGPHSTVDPQVTFAASPTVAAADAAEAKNPGPVLKSIDQFNEANPEAVTAAASAVQTLKVSGQKCTRRGDGTAKCTNKGCQRDFVVAENTPRSCTYHAANPVFHDTGKYWSCCPGKVKYDFDDFMKIAGCCTGYHQDGSGEFDNPESLPPAPPTNS